MYWLFDLKTNKQVNTTGEENMRFIQFDNLHNLDWHYFYSQQIHDKTETNNSLVPQYFKMSLPYLICSWKLLKLWSHRSYFCYKLNSWGEKTFKILWKNIIHTSLGLNKVTHACRVQSHMCNRGNISFMVTEGPDQVRTRPQVVSSLLHLWP